LVIGLLLVLLSVVVGARVLAGADDMDVWLSTRTALPAGHVLTDADLGNVSARLDDASSVRYYRAGSRAALVGRALSAPVGAGVLLPAEAVTPGPSAATRVVPVVVRAGRLPTLQPGDHVDVYALVKGSGGDREALVVADVEFLAGETLGNGDTSAQVRVAIGDAVRVVAASQSERVDLVRVDGPGVSSAGLPTEAPGLGG
jgi:hypothetical protein